jgi:DNA-binding phage protein
MSTATSGDLLDEEMVLGDLAEIVRNSGGQAEWARQTGVDRSTLNQVLRGRRAPTEQIIDALGLRRVTLPSKQDVLKRLKEEVARAGSHTEYARLTGLDRTHLTHVLNGRNPGPEIMKALNITSVVRYVRETSANPLRGA